MDAIIFCGIQATGKSTFFKNHFFKTHIRISLDLLKTRNREHLFLETCFKTQQSFVVDNTNPTKLERQKYIESAKKHKFNITGYYFKSNLEDALSRNSFRKGKEKIPEIGVRGTFKKLEIPSLEEGFNNLFCVEIIDNNFIITKINHEI